MRSGSPDGSARTKRMERAVIGRFRRLLDEALGQDLAEYAILISMIAVALIAAITLIGARLVAMYTAVAGAI